MVPRRAGRPPRRRALVSPTAALALLAVAGLAVAGCSSGPSGATLTQRRADAAGLLANCALLRNLLSGPAETSLSPARTPWLTVTGVTITPSDVAAFDTWYRGVSGDRVGGKTLADWQQWSAQNDQLPAALCGSDGQDPSGMQKQVYAADPAAGDPWGR